MHTFYGVERVSEIRRSELLGEAAAERRTRQAISPRTARRLPHLRVGRLVLEFGARIAGFTGAALRPTPRKTV